MQRESFDAIVIGAGQAGPPLAARLAGAGWKTALVEKRRLGGTCVNDGCIPTKTLVASARAAWVVANAARWGIVIEGKTRVDMTAVKARKDEVVQASRDSLAKWLGEMKNLTLVDGRAHFVDAHAIEVGGRTLEAKHFFINTGGRARVPEIPGLTDVPFLTNVEMMDLASVPEHLVVLGGSYIGLEFAQMYRRFGSRVTVVESAPALLPREDDDVARAITEMLVADGLDLRCGATVTRIEKTDGVRVVLEEGAVDGSHLLVGVGRDPNTGDLGLDTAGVAMDKGGYVIVDDELRTSQPHIFAMGDVNGRGAFTHTSYNDYEIVAANLLDGRTRKVSDRIPIYGVYVDPPLGRVGMTEKEARAAGKRLLIGTRPMTRVGRAKERGETIGFIKILVDADTKLILGASIFGVEGDEVIHVIADLMYARAPYTVLADAMHAHPTVAELLPTVVGELKAG